MSVAVSLLLGAMLVVWAAPYALRWLTQRTRRPDVVLTCWIAVTAGAAASVLAGGGLLLAGDWPHPSGGLAHPCWAALGHHHVHPADEVTGVVIIIAAVVALARAGRFAAHSVRAGRKARRAHLDMLRHFAPSDVDGVLWLTHEHPFAYSISGRPGVIVASTALQRLPAPQRDAVLAHERRHLRGRHHLLLLAALAAAAAVPKLPLLRRLPQAVEELTERIADADAAGLVGADAVREARAAVAPGVDTVATQDDDGRQTSLRGRARHLLAGLGPLAAPALAGAGLLFAAATLIC